MMFAIDMEQVNGQTGKNAYRGFDVKFNTTSEYSKPDTLQMNFMTDVPAEVLTDGAVVYQWAQYIRAMDFGGEKESVACKSVVKGSVSDVEILTYRGSNSLSDADVSGNNYSQQNSGDKVTGSGYVKSTDEQKYQSYDSEIPGNVFQSCMAEQSIPKIDRDFGMFGQYNVTTGIRVYPSASSSDFISLGEQSFQYTLNEPSYAGQDEAADYEKFYYALAEKEWDLNIGEAIGVSDYYAHSQQRVYTDFIVSPNYKDKDILRMTFQLDLPSEQY